MGEILAYATALGEDLAHVRVNVSGFALVGEVAIDELHEAQRGLPDVGFILGRIERDTPGFGGEIHEIAGLDEIIATARLDGFTQ
jgi:hypothetical protein